MRWDGDGDDELWWWWIFLGWFLIQSKDGCSSAVAVSIYVSVFTKVTSFVLAKALLGGTGARYGQSLILLEFAPDFAIKM
jgi:hypothetical protein